MSIIVDLKRGRTPSIGIRGNIPHWDEQDVMDLGGSFRRRSKNEPIEFKDLAHYEIPPPLMKRLFEGNGIVGTTQHKQPKFMEDWEHSISTPLRDDELVPERWREFEVTDHAAIFYRAYEEFEKDLNEIKRGNKELINRILESNGIFDDFWYRSPKDHQKAGVAFFLRSMLVRINHIMLFDEMRTGKTKQAIDIARYLLKKGLIKRVLVICPNSIKRQWQYEIMQDTEMYGYLSFIIEGTKARKQDLWESLGFFYILNYECARADKEFMYNWQEQHKHGGWMLICDESHRVRNPLAKQTQAVMGLKPNYSVWMTGTPVANRPENVFCMTDFVCRGLLGGTVEHFYRQFAYRGGKGGNLITGYKNLPEIEYRLARVSMRRKRKDVMMDVTIKQDRIGEMQGTQKTAYKQMRDELWVEIENSRKDWTAISAPNNLVKILRLQMITGGYLPKPPPPEVTAKIQLAALTGQSYTPPVIKQTKDNVVWLDDNWKLKELETFILEYLLDIGKIVVWSRYVPVLEMIHAGFAQWGTALIRGGMKSDEIFEEQNRFNTDLDCRIMVCNILSAEGKGFPAADFHWFWDKWWSPHLNKQAEDRTQGIAAQGDYKPTTVLSAITKDTIDERLEYLLQAKQEWSDAMLGDSDTKIKVPILDKNQLLYLIASPEEAEKYKEGI